MPRLTQIETDVVKERTSTTTRQAACPSQMPGTDRPPLETDIGVGLTERSRHGLARPRSLSPALCPLGFGPLLVVGTGVDPVTSRFSGARSTN